VTDDQPIERRRDEEPAKPDKPDQPPSQPEPVDQAPDAEPALEPGPEPVLLTAPRDGTPAPIVTDADLDRVVARFAEGTGPVAVDAERASGYRYTHRAYLVQLRRAGSGTVLIDPLPLSDLTTLNEIAHQSGVGMVLEERAIPVAPQVAAACELLGLDPLYVANEGKLVAIVPPEEGDAALAALRGHPLGREARRIGEVTADPSHFVQLRTALGGRRMVDWLSGEQLPRIC